MGPDRCVCCDAIIPEGRQICQNCEGNNPTRVNTSMLGYGKKSRLLLVKLVVKNAIKRQWAKIFGKGGKK